jgi:hypothetical protein
MKSSKKKAKEQTGRVLEKAGQVSRRPVRKCNTAEKQKRRNDNRTRLILPITEPAAPLLSSALFSR